MNGEYLVNMHNNLKEMQKKKQQVGSALDTIKEAIIQVIKVLDEKTKAEAADGKNDADMAATPAADRSDCPLQPGSVGLPSSMAWHSSGCGRACELLLLLFRTPSSGDS